MNVKGHLVMRMVYAATRQGLSHVNVKEVILGTDLLVQVR
jgi:hypothetical protein